MKGGFCHITVAHVHAFAPADTRTYRVLDDGEYYFVGDPVAFGYDGPKHAYFGAHPVVEADIHFGEPLYCYLDGAHYHGYAPPPRASFEVRAGVNWFVGQFEPVFFDLRPRFVVVNEVHRPIMYARPQVEVTAAPAGWRGHPPGRARAQAHVVVETPPPPRAHINIGVGLHLGAPAVVRHEHVVVEKRVPPGHAKHHGHHKHHGKGKGKHKWKD